MDLEAENTRLEGDTLIFQLNVQQGSYEMRLKIDGDQLEGVWKGSDASGAVKGTRQ
jgi:hypothetical protein